MSRKNYAESPDSGNESSNFEDDLNRLADLMDEEKESRSQGRSIQEKKQALTEFLKATGDEQSPSVPGSPPAA